MSGGGDGWTLQATAADPATKARLDCFVASAPRNDGVRFPLTSPRHCEHREAIQGQHRQTGYFNTPAGVGRAMTTNQDR
jgi:hypothetical protein